MRSLLAAAALVAAVLTGTLPFVALPAPARAATAPKVAVIVGPVGSATAGYKRDSDAAAAEALRYTPNVVKVYTPNATWAAAKAALQGASIVIYMGHGNGFPSPYTTSPAPDRQNGLGLNPTAGGDDTTTKYYGEQFLRNEVQLAPGAIVLLGHLCYASGSSEPGKAEPTPDQASQRVDNYAAGFLAIGARAVIAEAYGGGFPGYITALFTTRQSVTDMWLNSRTRQGTPISFQSTRTPGTVGQLDPDRSSGKYYRSIVADPAFTTEHVTGATGAPVTPTTPTDPANPGDPAAPTDPTLPTAPVAPAEPPVSAPASFAVPGAASVAVAAAPVFADPSLTPDPTTGAPVATLGLGTPVRLVAHAGTAPDGSAIFAIGAPGGGILGYMTASALQPADSLAPILLSMSAPPAFSPNGDGSNDTVTLSATLNEASSWELSITGPGGTPIATERGNGTTPIVTWDGTANGTRVPDGVYGWRVTATDGWGNGPVTRTGTVVVDTTPPPMTTATSTAQPVTFSPNGDGVNDAWTATFALGGPGTVEAIVSNVADGSQVRRLSATGRGSAATLAWNGRTDAGAEVPDGIYVIAVTGRDAAGNAAPAVGFTAIVFRAVAGHTVRPTVFHPHDRDPLATSTRLAFTLRQPATVSWSIQDGAGRPVFTKYVAAAFQPRSLSMVWAGLDDAGRLVAPGRYQAVLTVSNGVLTDTIRTPLVVGAFALSSSVATVRRGGSVTITAVSAEPLKAAPKLTYARPGLKAQTYSMKKIATNTYRLTIYLSNTGKAGTMAIKVSGIDTRGGTNASALNLPLR